MKEKLLFLLPEINDIKEDRIRDAVVETFIQALRMGGWEPEDIAEIPFTLMIENCKITFLVHTRAVVRMCMVMYGEYNEIYKSAGGYSLDFDTLIAGALLHDVGKLVEYKKNGQGKMVKSSYGKSLRHPFSGTALAVNNGVPYEIAHITANHSKEGDGTLRSPEAVAVNKIDMLNFDGIKAHLGIL
jgi:hypothetical protein